MDEQEQSPIETLAQPEIVRFISDALRAGERAILVTGRDQDSTRVPEAALTAVAGASARTLHIGPPLPEPAELQEMIGAAAEIAGGRQMDPLAMAARLLFLNPGQTVVLAIDDAHTLSHRSLSYLTEMTELLAPDEPVLQIVLAARPALLETLAQGNFESLRNRLCRQEFETPKSWREGEADGAHAGPVRLTEAALAQAQNADPMAKLVRARWVTALIGIAIMIPLVLFSFQPASQKAPVGQHEAVGSERTDRGIMQAAKSEDDAKESPSGEEWKKVVEETLKEAEAGQQAVAGGNEKQQDTLTGVVNAPQAQGPKPTDQQVKPQETETVKAAGPIVSDRAAAAGLAPEPPQVKGPKESSGVPAPSGQSEKIGGRKVSRARRFGWGWHYRVHTTGVARAGPVLVFR
jgi:hypothetical protein